MTRYAYTTPAHRATAAAWAMRIILNDMMRQYPDPRLYSDLYRRFYGRLGRGA